LPMAGSRVTAIVRRSNVFGIDEPALLQGSGVGPTV